MRRKWEALAVPLGHGSWLNDISSFDLLSVLPLEARPLDGLLPESDPPRRTRRPSPRLRAYALVWAGPSGSRPTLRVVRGPHCPFWGRPGRCPLGVSSRSPSVDDLGSLVLFPLQLGPLMVSCRSRILPGVRAVLRPAFGPTHWFGLIPPAPARPFGSRGAPPVPSGGVQVGVPSGSRPGLPQLLALGPVPLGL